MLIGLFKARRIGAPKLFARGVDVKELEDSQADPFGQVFTSSAYTTVRVRSLGADCVILAHLS